MMGSTIIMKPLYFLLVLYLFSMKCISSATTCSGLGQVENGRTFFRYGGIYANFACNPGFSLLGHVRSICIQGRWRKPSPVCIASGCHMPMGIVHGSLKTSHNNAVIIVTCKKGYKLVGSSLVYCDGKKWNSTIPVCRETDMMGSSLQKKNSEIEGTFVVVNPLSKREHIRVLLTATHKGHANSDIVSINKDITVLRKEKDLKNTMSSYHGQDLLKSREHQLESPKTILPFGDEKHLSQPSPIGFNAFRTTAATENIKNVTSGYSWSSTATQMQNSKTQKISQTSQIKAILNVTEWYYSTTPRSLGFTNTQTKPPHIVKHEYNIVTRSSVNSPLHLRTTTSNAQQTTQQVQSAYHISTRLENKTPANANRNPHNLLTVSKTIPPSTKPYNATTQMMTKPQNFSEDTPIKIEGDATTPAQIVTNITSSLIHYNRTLRVLVQTTKSPMVETAKVGVNTTFITGGSLTSYLEYKATLIQSTILSKPSNAKAYNTPALPGTTSTVTTITSNSKRNHKSFGILQRAYKRRVQCVYPPLPTHGTFRFLTIKDPLPNQYPYYIQYSCYPGYTMSTGDVHSFCKDNGVWSGITPLCEG